MACGGSIQTSVNALSSDVLGRCQVFEETQIGGERYNFFTGCPKAKTCTIILRGGAEQFMEETERSLHDAIMIVRRAIKNDSVVAGGGAIEMELSKYLRDYSRTIPGKQQLLIGAYAKALKLSHASSVTMLVLMPQTSSTSYGLGTPRGHVVRGGHQH